MLKILYISHLHPPKDAPMESIGGMQRVSMQLIDELEQRKDIELKTVIQHAPWKGIERKTAFFLMRLYFKLPKMAKDFDADVILFSSMVTASLASFLRKKINIPMVTINHGQDVTLPVGLYQKFIPKVFNALDGVISVSEATREECIKRGMDPKKGVALPNGFDMADFREVPDAIEAKAYIQKDLGVNFKNKFLLLTVGRQVKRKGHEWFIERVLPLIRNDVVYVAVGDGPQHEHLIEVSNKSDYKDEIILTGRKPDEFLKKIYAAADLFIMPNIPVPGDMEGFGIVLLEANLAGTAAVAANLEGIKDVIKDGKNGFKIEVKDAESFAQKIDEVLDEGPEEFGMQSRRYVRENFSWNTVAKRYISYLCKVIEQNKSNSVNN